MIHHATPRFWFCYDRLPEAVKKSADRCFAQLKENPRHPSLHYKKIGRIWSVRVGIRYRDLAVEKGDARIWFWIGTHAEYDKLVG